MLRNMEFLLSVLGIGGLILAVSGIFSLFFASFIRTGMGDEE